MKNYKYVKLSSGMTYLAFIGFLFAILIMALIGVAQFAYQIFEVNTWVFLLVVAVFIGLFALMAVYLAKAEIIDNEFHLRKFFGKREIFDIKQLSHIYTMGDHRGTSVLLTIDNNGKKERYYIFTSNLIFENTKTDSATILQDILEENKKNK
ncbi:hypothetical protein KRX57_04105 [Weeksellaceae bacterium TAE3-ERU29]|nr:hypothetical protein [Weeksellaceae bacterium TAE3-ERU29]